MIRLNHEHHLAVRYTVLLHFEMLNQHSQEAHLFKETTNIVKAIVCPALFCCEC